MSQIDASLRQESADRMFRIKSPDAVVGAAAQLEFGHRLFD